jgi:type VI secretion system protein ImpM
MDTSATASATVGFFGKLPCRGDFLRRRVPDEFVAPWDEWLQRCLTESREQFVQAWGDAWLEAYLAGPIWRFVLAEGVCGTGAYAGVLMPSVDRVGRFFPLTIVTQWADSACAIDVACGARTWFDSIEEIAADGMETTDLDAFDAKVARAESLMRFNGLDEASVLRRAFGRSEFPHTSAQWHVPLASVHSLQRAVNALAAREIERTLRPLSIWWSDGSDDVGAAWLCTRGLPDAQSFGAMLTGRWNGSGWNSAALAGARVAREREEVVSAPSVRIVADHAPVTRDWNAAPSATHFVVRPEIGLWGIVSSETPDADGTAAAQAFADALQGVDQAGSITVAAERVRDVLGAVQRQLARHASTGVPMPKPTVGVIVLVAQGDDCALVYTGPVQLAVQSTLQSTSPGDSDLELIPLNENPELLELVMGHSRGPDGIGVRYEALSPGDRWLLAASSLVKMDEVDVDALTRDGSLPLLVLTAEQE